MPAWSAILKEQGVEQVANYVLSLSGKSVDAARAEAGKAPFLQELRRLLPVWKARGATRDGCPELADNTWLYGV